MSTTKKPDINKARLLALKSVGVLKDVSARGKLTDSQKATVRKNWKKYHEVVTAPKGTYVKKDVSYYSAKEKKALKDSGYKIIEGKLFIDKQGSDTVSVKRTSNYDEKTGKKKAKPDEFIVVVRKKGDRKEETEFIGASLQKEKWRENLLAQYEAGGFKKGDYIGIKIGDNGIFRRRMYGSMNELFAYAEYDFDPKDGGKHGDKDFLLNKMHLVKMSVKDYRDLAATEKTKKQQNSERYQRSKKTKKLGVAKTKSKNKLVGKPRRK
jgi:hypothetical protein